MRHRIITKMRVSDPRRKKYPDGYKPASRRKVKNHRWSSVTTHPDGRSITSEILITPSPKKKTHILLSVVGKDGHRYMTEMSHRTFQQLIIIHAASTAMDNEFAALRVLQDQLETIIAKKYDRLLS